mgnify:CR=1 FL=1
MKNDRGRHAARRSEKEKTMSEYSYNHRLPDAPSRKPKGWHPRAFPTAIRKVSTGYIVVGAVPVELSRPVTREHTPHIPPPRESMVWETERDAMEALLALGITTFQKADDSWYQAAKR